MFHEAIYPALLPATLILVAASTSTMATPIQQSMKYHICPQFSGKQDECFHTWLADFTTCFQLYEWSEKKKHLIIAQALRDRAKLYHASLPTYVQVDASALLSKLQGRFGLEAQHVLLQIREFNKTQQVNESVIEYSSNLAKLYHRLKITDEAIKVRTFIQGLLPKYKEQIVIMRPATFEDAEQCAIILETYTDDCTGSKAPTIPTLQPAMSTPVQTLDIKDSQPAEPTHNASVPSSTVPTNTAPMARCPQRRQIYPPNRRQQIFPPKPIQRFSLPEPHHLSPPPTYSRGLRTPGTSRTIPVRKVIPQSPSHNSQNLSEVHQSLDSTSKTTQTDTIAPLSADLAQQSSAQTILPFNDRMLAYPSLAGSIVEVLVDTGARMSIINLKTLKSIVSQSQIDKLRGPSKYRGIQSITGHIQDILYCVSLPFSTGNFSTLHPFNVMDNFDTNVIIGEDFLAKHKVSVDFQHRSLRVYPPAKVRLVHEVTIQPHSKMTCSAVLEGESCPETSLFHLHRRTLNRKVKFNGVRSAPSGAIGIQLRNRSNTPKTFSIGKIVSTATVRIVPATPSSSSPATIPSAVSCGKPTFHDPHSSTLRHRNPAFQAPIQLQHSQNPTAFATPQSVPQRSTRTSPMSQLSAKAPEFKPLHHNPTRPLLSITSHQPSPHRLNDMHSHQPPINVSFQNDEVPMLYSE